MTENTSDFQGGVCNFDMASENNFSKGRKGEEVKVLILHYTVTKTLDATIKIFKNPANEVSSHYVVGVDGKITQMVKEADTAYHAGKSSFAGITKMNNSSIGIEIVNLGYTPGESPNKYPEQQINAVKLLCQDIINRYNIKPFLIVGHSDVAPARKIDPGPYFPWLELAEDGIGLFPELDDYSNIAKPTDKDIAMKLEEYGYDVRDLANAKKAFQSHFNPESYINKEVFSQIDMALLEELIELKKSL